MSAKTEWLTKMGLKQAANLRFYSPVVLHGTVYIGAAVSGFIYFTLKDWKIHESDITHLDVMTLRAGCLWTAFTTWAAFMSKKVAELGDAKKKQDETDFAKSTTGKEGHLR